MPFFCSRYESRNLSAPIKANLHFSLSRSGVLTLDRAEAVFEITEWVEVLKKIPTVDNSSTSVNVSVEASPSVNSSAEVGSGDSADDAKANLQTDGTNDPSNFSGTENIAEVIEKKLKKRTFRVPLKVPLLCLHKYLFHWKCMILVKCIWQILHMFFLVTCR